MNDPVCCSCGDPIDGYVVVCDHGFSMHEDVCNPEHEGLADPCPVGRAIEGDE